MTSSNINKIMRSNISLKPWILSKNTSEIVNTCIQKIYKQSQNNFKNDPTKTTSSKLENKGPIRAFKTQASDRIPLSINVTRAKNGSNGVTTTTTGNIGAGTVVSAGAVTTTTTPTTTVGAAERLANNATTANNRRSAVASIAANRKFLKSSPNYKIYSSRRFGSSASSSNASIFRRTDERRRPSTQTAQLNYLLRAFATQMNSHKPSGMNKILPKFVISARNQHIDSYKINDMPTHVSQLASAIQRDLMPINSAIKDRIALGRPRVNKAAIVQKSKNQDPMNGWYHPRVNGLFLSNDNQSGLENTELQEQYQRTKNAARMRQFEHINKMEKRNSILGSYSKKSMQPRIVDEFEIDGMAVGSRVAPRPAARNQTPNFEQAYKTLLTRHGDDSLVVVNSTIPPTLPPINISHITSVEKPSHSTTLAKVSQHSNVTSSPYDIHTTTQQSNAKINETQSTSTTTALSTGNTSIKAFTLPSLTKTCSENEASDSSRMFTMTKKSATSKVVSRAAELQNQMRFNHSEHLKKC